MRRRLRFTLRLAMVAVAFIAIGIAAVQQTRRRSEAKKAETSFERTWGELLAPRVTPAELAELKTEYLAGYWKGREEAEQELAQARATLYTYGLREDFENVDRETGLPYEVIAGCKVDLSDHGRADGHNDRILADIKQRGLPPNSFKRWDQELFDLNGFFEVRRRESSPLRLTSGGPGARSPDGLREVRAVKQFYEKDDGSRAQGLAVAIVGTGDGARRLITLLWNPEAVELVWGPKGSGFAIVRVEKGGRMTHVALDLRRGVRLREEYQNVGPLPPTVLPPS